MRIAIEHVYDAPMPQDPPAIELATDISEWLIGKAIRYHSRDFGAALDHVLRAAKAREEAEPPNRVPEPVDLWAGVTAEARERHGR